MFFKGHKESTMSNIFGKFCNCLLAFISQVTVRLVIYFDQQIMKEFTTETASITTSTLELSSSLVCLTDVPSNLSTQSTTQGDNRAMESTESEDDEYKGIGNIVGGISEKKSTSDFCSSLPSASWPGCCLSTPGLPCSTGCFWR